MIEMLRKLIVVPFVVGILGIAYLLACLLVLLTRGSRWPLEKKLAIGCLLISLHAIPPSSSWAAGSCYEQAMPEFLLEGERAGATSVVSVVVTRNVTDEIPAVLRLGQSYRFTFQVASGAAILAEGEVLPRDGKLDSSAEQAKLAIDYRKVPAGTYDLVIFCSFRSGDGWRRMESPIRRLKLRVEAS